MFLRVVVIVGVAGPDVFASMIGPLATMLAVSVVIAMGMWFLTRKEPVKPPDPENPSELRSAIVFGLIFAIVLLGVAAARHYFGSRGLYVVAAVSGLTDMDAITLSTLELVKSKQTEPIVAWRMILIAATANFVFKGVLVATLGDRKLLARIAPPFGIAIAAATLIILLWPHSGN
jgi:uncharacterized membrane protein (DUF4010 family)